LQTLLALVLLVLWCCLRATSVVGSTIASAGWACHLLLFLLLQVLE
jgi:hypothetical protein